MLGAGLPDEKRSLKMYEPVMHAYESFQTAKAA
jgi:hypothetical protein